MRCMIIFAALTLCWSSANAQEIVRGEWWVDNDPGFGLATPFDPALPVQANIQAHALGLAPNDLTPGAHTIGYRTRGSNGRWSLTNLKPIYITHIPTNAAIVRTEYFLNTDPGWGNGYDAAADGSPNVIAALAGVNTSTGARGANTVFYRSLDASGRWGLTNHKPLHLVDSTTGVIDRIETFWDEDPGFGSGAQQVIDPGVADLMTYVLQAPVPAEIIPGTNHTLFVRSHASHGRWSLTNFRINVEVIDSLSVGENSAALVGISVFPNPFTEAFTVQPADAQPLRVILYDPQGKLVHDEVLNTSKRIDLSGLSNGAYTAFFWKELEWIHRVTLIKQ